MTQATTEQPAYTSCGNCGSADHKDYACPCQCHLRVERAPRGTWSSAFLVTDYFAVESRTRRVPIKWRAKPARPTVMARLRRRAALAAFVAGIDPAAERLEPRPGAGQPVFGPWPLPSPRPKRPAPSRILPIRADFRPEIPVVGSWFFRSGLAHREADRRPMFDCIGLILPGKAV